MSGVYHNKEFAEEEEEIDLEDHDYDELTLNDISTNCDDREGITGSPELRLQELRLTLLCFVFSIKFFQNAFSAGFTLLAIQSQWINDFISNHYWTILISWSVWAGLYYYLRKVRFSRRFPLNLTCLLILTLAMAYSFAVLALQIWPYPYMILVALITASTIFFMVIPVAIIFKVDENGYGVYKHLIVMLPCIVAGSHVPYVLSIGPRYDVGYGEYLVNIVGGTIIGALICLEGFVYFKKHMNSGRLTSLANLEGIFSASVS